MKYYETTFEEYLHAIEKHNFHPELYPIFDSIPSHKDVIFYGPSGIGKYSQVLKYLQPISPSQLSYFKKITVFIERVKNKTPYTIFMSDIHFEIDLAVLGCNAKKVWHEIFIQLVDIVKIREHKRCFFVCKNFHSIHSELLEIFYSYMQHYRPREISLSTSGNGCNEVQISFILITEHLSFVPNQIYQSCSVVPVKRPSISSLKKGLHIIPVHDIEKDSGDSSLNTAKHFLKRIQAKKQTNYQGVSDNHILSLIHAIDNTQVLNLKEYNCFNLLPICTPTPSDPNPKNSIRHSLTHLSDDIFNKVCDQIIEKITQIPVKGTAKWFASFRDALYSILICNLDASECVCYILQHFITHPPERSPFNSSSLPGLNTQSVTKLMQQIYPFLLYYNNNYRPIYHLEIIFLRMVVELYHF